MEKKHNNLKDKKEKNTSIELNDKEIGISLEFLKNHNSEVKKMTLEFFNEEDCQNFYLKIKNKKQILNNENFEILDQSFNNILIDEINTIENYKFLDSENL